MSILRNKRQRHKSQIKIGQNQSIFAYLSLYDQYKKGLLDKILSNLSKHLKKDNVYCLNVYKLM